MAHPRYDTTPRSPGRAVLAVLLATLVALAGYVLGGLIALLGPLLMPEALIDAYPVVALLVSAIGLLLGAFAGAAVAMPRLYRAGYDTGMARFVIAVLGPFLLAVIAAVVWIATGGPVLRGLLDPAVALIGAVAGAALLRTPKSAAY